MPEPTYGRPISSCEPGVPCSDGPRTCTTPIHVSHQLFEVGKQMCESHVFEVTDKPAIITGFEFSYGACARVEMVEGCGGGDYFAPFTIGCNKGATISACNNRIVLDIPGRYRLVWNNCEQDEAAVFVRFATIPYAPAYITKHTGCCDPCVSSLCGCGGPCSGACGDFLPDVGGA